MEKYDPYSKETFITKGDRKITINYTGSLNGGGPYLADKFIFLLNKHYPNRQFNHCLEWCSGPGFIGFEAFSQNVCSEITFMDIHEPALNNILETIQHNNLITGINLRLSGTIKDLPPNKYDLILGNPPHYSDTIYLTHPNQKNDIDSHRRMVDKDLIIHKEFFSNISNYLTDDGVIIICESYVRTNNDERGINPHRLFPLITSGGLQVVDIYTNKDVFSSYYLVLEKLR